MFRYWRRQSYPDESHARRWRADARLPIKVFSGSVVLVAVAISSFQCSWTQATKPAPLAR